MLDCKHIKLECCGVCGVLAAWALSGLPTTRHIWLAAGLTYEAGQLLVTGWIYLTEFSRKINLSHVEEKGPGGYE